MHAYLMMVSIRCLGLRQNFINHRNQAKPVRLGHRIKTEPYANIKAALEDITQESAMDLNGSIPRLRQTALVAARAVGYYDIDLSIIRNSIGEVDVIIHDLGEPVYIDYRAVEVRGEGADDKAFTTVADEVPLLIGDVFHHGKYETKKSHRKCQC